MVFVVCLTPTKTLKPMKYTLLLLILLPCCFVNAQSFTPLEELIIPYCEKMEVISESYTTTERVYEDVSTDCSTDYQWVIRDVRHSRKYVTVEGRAIPFRRQTMESYFQKDDEAYKYFKRSYANGKSSTFFSITSGLTLTSGLIYVLATADWPEGGGSTDSDYDDDDDDDWGGHDCLPTAVAQMQYRSGEEDPVTTSGTTTTHEEPKKEVNTKGIITTTLFATGVTTLILAIQKHKAKKKNMEKAFDTYNSNVSTCAALRPELNLGVSGITNGKTGINVGLIWRF
jgi:hypothetical protein